MKKNRYTTRQIEEEVRSYYEEAVRTVKLAPVPPLQAADDKKEDRKNNAPLTFRFALPRAAAALLLIAFGTFFFIRPVKSNPLAETFIYLTEEKQLNEKIVSGLQRAGHFISDTLENNEQGVKQ